VNIQQYIHKNHSDVYLGCGFAILAAVGAAVSDVLPKSILDDHISDGAISPIVFVTIVFVINAILFSIRKKPLSLSKIARKHLAAIIGAGIAEAIGVILYYEGLKSIFATDAVIISNSHTLFGVILVMIIFHEVIKRREIIPIILILIGAILLPIGVEISQSNNSDLNLVSEGSVLIVASSMIFAIDVVLCRYALQHTDYHFRDIMRIVFISGAMVCLLFLFLFEDLERIEIPTYEHVPTILVSGIFGTGLSSLFFLIALKKIGATRTIIVFSSNSIIAVVIAAIYLSEKIQINDWISIAFIMVGVYILKDKI